MHAGARNTATEGAVRATFQIENTFAEGEDAEARDIKWTERDESQEVKNRYTGSDSHCE